LVKKFKEHFFFKKKLFFVPLKEPKTAFWEKFENEAFFKKLFQAFL
jgi:hypothetical protein